MLDRLKLAIERGSDSDIDRWAATGVDGLLVLHDVLTGAVRTEWSVDARQGIDNTSGAVAAIADRHPGEFLDVLGPELDSHTFVLTGLAQIDDPRATERLARASETDNMWLRIYAAIGLGRRQSPTAVAALVRLLRDSEYLVRYHALRGLAAIGDASALAAVRTFSPPTDTERELAHEAISRISERMAGAGRPPRP